ncbi:Uncharacterised protein [Mycobacteroides abscessus subsp. abscessus]|nr:Uncharacterised protein [Mycobacteroides abscessus subsp. abscessus]
MATAADAPRITNARKFNGVITLTTRLNTSETPARTSSARRMSMAPRSRYARSALDNRHRRDCALPTFSIAEALPGSIRRAVRNSLRALPFQLRIPTI